MKIILTTVLTTIILFSFSACDSTKLPIPESEPSKEVVYDQSNNMTENTNAMKEVSKVSEDTKIVDVINNPAFEGFGKYIFPIKGNTYDLNTRVDSLSSSYNRYIHEDTTFEILDCMLGEVNSGNRIFYDIYDEQDVQADAAKSETGLFFFRGKPGAPFAIICAGGGFSYVCSVQEGFPHALELSKKGYNAFVIEYRTGGAKVACEDLAAALSFIFANSAELKVSTDGYSIWGSSAGARMVAYLGSYGSAAYGGDDLPRPNTIVMAYTGHTDYTKNDPPTYVVVGENDGIAGWRIMEQRVNALKDTGIDTEFHKYSNLGHGFGLGVGTTAEGWLDDAAVFWEKHINE